MRGIQCFRVPQRTPSRATGAASGSLLVRSDRALVEGDVKSESQIDEKNDSSNDL